MLDLALSITVLAAIALLGGAWLAWKRNHRKQALLMLVLVGVALINVAIWTVPDEGGTAPLDRIERGTPNDRQSSDRDPVIPTELSRAIPI